MTKQDAEIYASAFRNAGYDVWYQTNYLGEWELTGRAADGGQNLTGSSLTGCSYQDMKALMIGGAIASLNKKNKVDPMTRRESLVSLKVQPMQFSAFLSLLGLKLRLTTYTDTFPAKYLVSIERGEIKENSSDQILCSASGSGSTKTAAIHDYVSQIRGKLLVINAYDKNKRREYLVPDSLEYDDSEIVES